MIPLTHILRQHNTKYQLGDGVMDGHRKINHLLFMDDLMLYGKGRPGNTATSALGCGNQAIIIIITIIWSE